MRFIIRLLATITILTSTLLPAAASAVSILPTPGTNPGTTTVDTSCGNGDNTAKGQVLQGSGQTGADCTGSGVNKIVSAAVTILSVVVGIAAVIMIIISGFKYITSGGDSNGIASAKNTLIYALVGVAVAALAQVLVHFVLVNAAPTPCVHNLNYASNSTSCVLQKKK